MRKHWDIKRTSREKWTAADYSMHKFFKTLPSRGHIANGRVWLLMYNAERPSKSLIITDSL